MMQSIRATLIIFCSVLIFSFNGIEAKRRNKFARRLVNQSLKAWYGPVTIPDECKSDGRTAKPILKYERKPSELCTDVI